MSSDNPNPNPDAQEGNAGTATPSRRLLVCGLGSATDPEELAYRRDWTLSNLGLAYRTMNRADREKFLALWDTRDHIWRDEVQCAEARIVVTRGLAALPQHAWGKPPWERMAPMHESDEDEG